jgi:asparagine synthase (glutamine-hydrolysing)
MMSDVPLGIFLSGGLDSTAIAALARAAFGPSLNTFAVGFDEPGFDERTHAALVARALGTRHHSLTRRAATRRFGICCADSSRRPKHQPRPVTGPGRDA